MYRINEKKKKTLLHICLITLHNKLPLLGPWQKCGERTEAPPSTQVSNHKIKRLSNSNKVIFICLFIKVYNAILLHWDIYQSISAGVLLWGNCMLTMSSLGRE